MREMLPLGGTLWRVLRWWCRPPDVARRLSLGGAVPLGWLAQRVGALVALYLVLVYGLRWPLPVVYGLGFAVIGLPLGVWIAYRGMGLMEEDGWYGDVQGDLAIRRAGDTVAQATGAGADAGLVRGAGVGAGGPAADLGHGHDGGAHDDAARDVQEAPQLGRAERLAQAEERR